MSEFHYDRGPSKYRRWVIIGAGILAVILLGAGAYALFKPEPKKPQTKATVSEAPKNETKKVPEYSSLTGRYMFSGTIVLDRAVATDAKGDYNQPFSKMDTFGTFDAAEADLECPVTGDPFVSKPGQDIPRFNCHPEWLPTLKKYFPIIKLAGNHTYDMGPAGYTETVKRLGEAGFQTVGNYSPHADKDHNCEVVALPVRLEKADNSEVKGTLPIAFCTFNYKILFAPEAGEIETIQRFAKIMPVFGLLQAGAEYVTTASAQQQTYARKIIDNGAAFVIANGTHYVQNSEAYKGKLIVYSLGNFIFDQLDYESTRNVSIGVTMDASYDDNVAKWLALGESCQPRPDNCLAEAEKQGLSKIDVKLNYEAIAGSSGAHKITKKADATLQAAVEERLQWAQTLAGLKE